MVISSNTLFHFTSSIENLLGILQNEFYPQFALESFSDLVPNLLEEMRECAIPMVSFCDIPLSLISKHVNEYGSYGIGLTKSWGIEHKVNPIVYAIKGTAFCDYLNEMQLKFQQLLDLKMDVHKLTKKPFNEYDYMLTIELISFIKSYEGKSHKTGKQKIFYDEREWRYIPPLSVFANTDLQYRLTKEEYGNMVHLDRANKQFEFAKIRLSFEPKDIKYLLVKNCDEIFNLIELINKIKMNFPFKDVEILKTKIISADQIECDF